MLQFTDTVTLEGTRITRDGYLVADAQIARIGIQVYAGSEVGRPAMETVRVYRSPEQVFDKNAMGSFAHRPVTNDHPQNMVDASNWKRVAVGQLGEQVARDGDFVRVPLVLMDADAISDVQKGKRELSCGYLCDLDWTPGITPDGEEYDASQVNIAGNHLAIVRRGRAGASCRIGDSWSTPPSTAPSGATQEPHMAELTLRTVMVDGFTVSTTDQGLQAIERLQAQLRDSTALATAKDAAMAALRTEHQVALDGVSGQLAALRSNHKAALDAKDGEIAAIGATHKSALDAKDGEIATLRTQIPAADALDALVESRARTVASAKMILGDSYASAGKTDDQVRRDAVVKRLPAGLADGKSDEWIRASFDTLTAAGITGTHSNDPIRTALLQQDRIAPPATGRTQDVDQARQEASEAKQRRNARLEASWKLPVAAA